MWKAGVIIPSGSDTRGKKIGGGGATRGSYWGVGGKPIRRGKKKREKSHFIPFMAEPSSGPKIQSTKTCCEGEKTRCLGSAKECAKERSSLASLTGQKNRTSKVKASR